MAVLFAVILASAYSLGSTLSTNQFLGLELRLDLLVGLLAVLSAAEVGSLALEAHIVG